MRMARLWFGLVVAAIAFTVYCIVDCLMTTRLRVRGLPKGVWVLVILLIPIVGGILWFIIGRGPASVRRAAPDDDPAFLSSLQHAPRAPKLPRAAQRAKDDEQELRRLEEELAKLDSDPGDDDGDDSSRRA
jgi:Phospholipase_D-nuclease N-terminal